MRLDKLIWAVRLFKTRSLAAKACKANKVKLNGEFSKPGKTVVVDNEISIKVIPIWRTFKVLAFPNSRVGAKLVHQFITETTSLDKINQLIQVQELNKQNKLLGIKGRPTKKTRRDLDNLTND